VRASGATSTQAPTQWTAWTHLVIRYSLNIARSFPRPCTGIRSSVSPAQEASRWPSICRYAVGPATHRRHAASLNSSIGPCTLTNGDYTRLRTIIMHSGTLVMLREIGHNRRWPSAPRLWTWSCLWPVDWPPFGPDHGHYSEDNPGDAVAWTAPQSNNLCNQVSGLLTSATNWNSQHTNTWYKLGGDWRPNSNTFAHELANDVGFTNVTAPPKAPGW
jgi:hypothetical protein